MKYFVETSTSVGAVSFLACILGVKLKVKCTIVQALRLCTSRTAHRGSRGIALLFLVHGTRRGCGVSVTPCRSFPPEKTRYPLYRRLGRTQGRSRQVRKISSPPGFDPRTVQHVASRYTDYATRLTFEVYPVLISSASRLCSMRIFIFLAVCFSHSQ